MMEEWEPKIEKTALVHHWLLYMTGGERVCEAICELIPGIDLFSLLADVPRLSPVLRSCSITTSFLQRLPFARGHHRYFAPLFPLAVDLLDLSGYDLVITSDSSVVKGVLTAPDTCHVCYCHSPMRYAWNMSREYLKGLNLPKRWAMGITMHYLRIYDYSAAARVDFFAANSHTVKNRIAKYYRRKAEVIHPPCDVKRFEVSDGVGDYYLCAGRLVGYKRADLAVQAFNETGKRLLIAGGGPDERYLKSIAGKNVEVLGRVSDKEMASLYAGCKALVFPGEEDFGIVPVEAQACGRPVIAYGKGGALETVVPGKTGVFFTEQTPRSLNRAVDTFERSIESFQPFEIRRNAAKFSTEVFRERFGEFLKRCRKEHATARLVAGNE